MSKPYTTILAPNPSIMTGSGTNTIVLGDGSHGALVIDPADDNAEHIETIIRAGDERGGIRRVLITHGHPDHIGGATVLRDRLGVLIYAFNRQGTPIADKEISDGQTFPAGEDVLQAIHTPGHRFDHLCFLLAGQRILFGGDIVAGEGTVVVAPPEGNMADYLQTLKRLQSIDIAEIVPAHGPVITDPQEKLAAYIAHRLERERQVLSALRAYPQGVTIATIVPTIYSDVTPHLHMLAAHSVEAHLLKLEREGQVKHLQKEKWILA